MIPMLKFEKYFRICEKKDIKKTGHIGPVFGLMNDQTKSSLIDFLKIEIINFMTFF